MSQRHLHRSPRRISSPTRYYSPRRQHYYTNPVVGYPLAVTNGLVLGTAAAVGLSRPYPYNPYYDPYYNTYNNPYNNPYYRY